MKLYVLLVLESVVLMRRSLDATYPVERAALSLPALGPPINAMTLWIVLAAVAGFDPRNPLPPPTGTIVVIAVLAFPFLLAGIAFDLWGSRHVTLAQQLGLSTERMLARGTAYFLWSIALLLVAAAFASVWKTLHLERG